MEALFALKLGSSTFWWKDKDLTPALLQEMARGGIAAVELCDYHPNFNYLRAKWLQEIGTASRDAGLEIATVHTHIKWHDPALHVMHADPVRLRRAVEAYLRAVDALAILGAKVLLTHDVQLTGDGSDRAERERAIGAVREIADHAQAAGILVVLENLPAGWSSNVPELRRFVADVDHPNVKSCFDTAHARRGGGDVAAQLRSAAPHVAVLHINDSGANGDHLLPGEGEIPWRETMAAVRETAATAHFIYELADCTNLARLKENFLWLAGLAG